VLCSIRVVVLRSVDDAHEDINWNLPLAVAAESAVAAQFVSFALRFGRRHEREADGGAEQAGSGRLLRRLLARTR
jgi:hypothetical protein